MANMLLSSVEFENLSDLLVPVIEAYRKGIDAANTMLSLQTCPYPALSIERKAWMRGYQTVRDEDYQEAQKQAIRATYGKNLKNA